MAIDLQTFIKANEAMRSHTNRAILFTTINPDKAVRRLSAYLPDLEQGRVTWNQFREDHMRRLTVRSFAELLDKFEPCFYYRFMSPQEIPSVNTEEPIETDETDTAPESLEVEEALEGEDVPEIETESLEGEETQGEDEEDNTMDVAQTLPRIEFSLEGGPESQGWRRILVTADHPLLVNLTQHLQQRRDTSEQTVNVNVDQALWGFHPEDAERLMQKSAADLSASLQRLSEEIENNPKSTDARRAFDQYERNVKALENAISDDLRVLPVIASGLATVRRALGPIGGGFGVAKGNFVLEIGEKGQAVLEPAPIADTLKALPGISETTGDNKPVLLRQALQSRQLVPRDKHKKELSIEKIAQLPNADRAPAVIGKFMNRMVKNHKIQPGMANMLAVILQDSRQLATWNILPREVEVFHDTFLGIYSRAVENFMKVVAPLFETLIGIYALFNEYPADVRTDRPELIIANDELSDLWKIYNAELSHFFMRANLQATNQYVDAISFAIVPSVSPFRNEKPAEPAGGKINAGNFEFEYHNPENLPGLEDVEEDDMFGDIKKTIGDVGSPTNGFGRVAGAPEVLGLMKLGFRCGFSVFFSPEERILAGYTRPEYLRNIQTGYCVGSVVDQDWAVSGVCCVPDFICIPRGGTLYTGQIIGRGANDNRHVGAKVPEMVARSCYIAAGRIMANDDPEVLKSMIRTHKAYSMRVNTALPGLAVDLGQSTLFGESNLAPDHSLSDDIIGTLLRPQESFLVFNHVRNQSPNIAAARTLRRVPTSNGSKYILLYHWRQQTYLMRLFYAAYYIGLSGVWPNAEKMATLVESLISDGHGWYGGRLNDAAVNSFPNKLTDDTIIVNPIPPSGPPSSYEIRLPFEDAVIGPMEIIF